MGTLDPEIIHQRAKILGGGAGRCRVDWAGAIMAALGIIDNAIAGGRERRLLIGPECIAAGPGVKQDDDLATAARVLIPELGFGQSSQSLARRVERRRRGPAC